MKKFILFVASGFGLGLVAPVAPGTFGSLPGVFIVYFLSLASLPVQIASAAALSLAAIPVCGAAEKALGIKDDGRITADEWMLFPISFIGIPLLSLPWCAMGVFFCVVRIVDIVKPFPCRRLQSLPGGLGIVIDDFVANLYSLLLNHLLVIAFFAFK